MAFRLQIRVPAVARHGEHPEMFLRDGNHRLHGSVASRQQ